MEQIWNSSMNVRILFSSFMYQSTRQFGFPLTLKRTWMYALIISNRRLAMSLTFVKTLAVTSTVCHVLLCIAMLTLYIKCPTCPRTKGTLQKRCTFALPYPHHVKGLGACLNRLVHYNNWERTYLSRKLMFEI